MIAPSTPPAGAGLVTGLAADASPGESLAPWTSLRIGGPAELLGPAPDAATRWFAPVPGTRRGLPVHVLGGGANTLVGDLGIRGLTLKLPPDFFAEEVQPAGPAGGGLVTLGAGAAIVRLLNVMRARGWVGAEFLAGIPGTIGGAVAMNAGTKHGECERVLDAVELATPDGIGWVPRSALTLRYRFTELPAGAVITRARFRLSDGDVEASRAAMDADLAYRKRTQPLEPAELRQRLHEPAGGPRRPAHRLGRAEGREARRRANLHAARQLDRQPRRCPRRRRGGTHRARARARARGLGHRARAGGEAGGSLRMKNRRIGVLMGGLSVEREVSFRTGAGVAAALRSLGYHRGGDSTCRRTSPSGSGPSASTWPSSPCMAATARTAASRGCSSRCSFPTPARGCSRPRWAWRRCSPSRSSQAHHIPTPAYRSFDSAEQALAGLESLPFPFPVVVKPSREGSSVGVHICHTEDAYPAAVEDAAKLAGSILVEQFVKGREVQGAVLDDASLGAIEIVPAHEFYDYEAKYQAGSGTRYLFPAPLPPGPVRPGERGLPRRAPRAGLPGRDPLGRHRHARRVRCSSWS